MNMEFLNVFLRRRYCQCVKKFGSSHYPQNNVLKFTQFSYHRNILKNGYMVSSNGATLVNNYSTRHLTLKHWSQIQSFSKFASVTFLTSRQWFHTSQKKNMIKSQPRLANSGRESNKEDNDDDGWMNSSFKRMAFSLFSVLTIASILRFYQNEQSNEGTKYVSWNEFLYQMLAKGEVEQLLVNPNINIVTIFLQKGAVVGDKKVSQHMYLLNITDVEKFEFNLREAESNLGIKPEDGVKVVYKRFDESTLIIVSTGLAIFAMMFFLRHLSKGASKISNFFPMSRAKYTFIDPLMPRSGKGVQLCDVAGAHEAKQEVMEFVDFLKNPERYQRLGARVPKGALLLGPPGCGKTLLAKAVATEGKVPFLSMNGSEFVEVIGGLGAARVRDLFKQAKSHSPCIIYIDEIDAIGRQRGGGRGLSAGDGGAGESEQTLNQLLVEMDGILSKEGVLLLASTNRLDILDKALLRPGRFDRQIMMDLPTQTERCQIFKHHLKSVTLEFKPEVYAQRMASLTLGFTGADIANIVNEAALYAARNAKKVIGSAELEHAVERVLGGTEKRSTALSSHERRVIAYHESGHALMGWLLEHTDTLLKVTIVPRTNHSLGFAQYAPKDKQLCTQEELFEKMCMALGGRVAETIKFNRITTGAQNDLEKVTDLAYSQVRRYGFCPNVGHLSFPHVSANEGRRPYSNKLAHLIDKESSQLIFTAYKKTEQVLTKNINMLNLLAENLLERETLSYNDVELLLGPPPFGDKNSIQPLHFEGEMNGWKEEQKEEGA